MSVPLSTVGAVELTAAQQRTLEGLIGTGPPTDLDPGVAGRIRGLLERDLAGAGVRPGGGEPIWLGKHRLGDRDRCEGLFLARLLREGPGFAHSSTTAAGALFHKAIELDVAVERGLDPRSLCERAAGSLDQTDGAFGKYWRGLDDLAQAELLTDAGRHLVLFRSSFPPMSRRWAPQPELHLKAALAGGRVVLSGTPDLVLGRTIRLVLDFKSGGAYPEHPEDMRFYALLLLLRFGAPPYRVATFFLDSGEWQAEDVTEGILGHAAGRVVASAAAAARLAEGDEPELRPGRHCGWCPRRTRCPAASAFDQPEPGESSDAHGLLPDEGRTYRSARPNHDDPGHVRDRPASAAGRDPPADVRARDPAGAVR